MYNYPEIKPRILTDEGQRKFLEVRDKAQRLLKDAGAFRMQEVMDTGDSWTSLACVDRMVELGEIRELTGATVCGQHRVFVSARECLTGDLLHRMMTSGLFIYEKIKKPKKDE